MAKVYKYEPEGMGNPCVYLGSEVFDLLNALENEDIGNKVIISIEEMTLEEFQKLPEHTGW